MTFLIDGYNLLHGMGLLAKDTGPHGLEKARLRLIGLMRALKQRHQVEVIIVFDAPREPSNQPAEQDYDGVRCLFAAHHAEADDLIEEIIQRHSAPKQLAVVSDDARLQKAARSRSCQAYGCGAFLDELERRRNAHKNTNWTRTDEKSTQGMNRDRSEWLAAFADLEDDPNFQELNRWEDVDLPDDAQF